MKFNLLSSTSLVALGSALSLLTLGGHANAAMISGSDAITVSGVAITGGNGTLLGGATAITIGTNSDHWATPGAFQVPITNGNKVINSALLTLASLGSYNFTGNDGTFQAVNSLTIGPNTFTTGVVGSSGSASAGTETLSIYLVGNFKPAGDFAAFTTNNASETMSFTETGIKTSGGTVTNDGSLSFSATFAAPASAPVLPPPPPGPPGVPEPASLALLGVGLAGLGAIRRRRKTQS